MKSYALAAAGSLLLALAACNEAGTENEAADNLAEANAAEATTDNSTDEAATNAIDGKPAAAEPSAGDAAAGATGKPPADEAVPADGATSEKPTS